MKTTLQQIELAGEVLDLTDFATQENVKEIIEAVENAKPEIDFTPIEEKIDEVKDAVGNIDLSPVEMKVDEGVATLSTKIDNIDLSAVAQQETLKEVAQAFGITSATEYTPMTDSEIESEMITIWNNAFNN